MCKRVMETEGKKATVQSYLGLLQHGNGYTLRKMVIKIAKDSMD